MVKRRFCLWGTLSHNNKNLSVLFNPRFTSRKKTRNLLSPLKRPGLLSLPNGILLKCGQPNAGLAHVCGQESCSYLVLSRWHATTAMWTFRNLGWSHHPLNKDASVTGGCGCHLEVKVWKSPALQVLPRAAATPHHGGSGLPVLLLLGWLAHTYTTHTHPSCFSPDTAKGWLPKRFPAASCAATIRLAPTPRSDPESTRKPSLSLTQSLTHFVSQEEWPFC